MHISKLMYDLIAVLSLFNFGHIFLMLAGSDLYDIKQILSRRKDKSKIRYNPKISVVIPAYNEQTGVIRTLESVLNSSYRNKQVIVVNDGSKDNTLKVLKNYQRKHPKSFTIVNQLNAGKAAAINRAVKCWAKGSLVMVLDADSLLHEQAIEKIVAHFRDQMVIAAASNVKIIPNKKILGITQQFEYLISYRMKRALTVMKMEYIIGGVGSTFRKRALIKAGLYDTDTMTEDIDLTLKLINLFGNRQYKVHYAADALTYTEHVLSFRALVNQRFRWKYGRLQSLRKHRSLFFNSNPKYTKRLTVFQLPYAIFGEISLLLEPILVIYILYIAFRFADWTSLLLVYLIISAYIFLIMAGEDSERFRTKVLLSLTLPFMYFTMYVLTIVELAALLKSIYRSPQLLKDIGLKEVSWEHVERSGKSVTIRN